MRSARTTYQFPITLAALSGAAAVVLLAACSTEPTGPTRVAMNVEPLFAKPVPCVVAGKLRITMRDAVGDAIASDGGGAYEEGIGGVAAHLSGVNGNLMLAVSGGSRRYSYITTAGSGLSDDRLYTNNHTNPGGNNGCGLEGMVVGSTGSAVVEAELLRVIGEDVLRYGKDCAGSVVVGTKATTTHPTANTWTITGATGVLCRPKTKGNGYNQVGTAGVFAMSLERVP